MNLSSTRRRIASMPVPTLAPVLGLTGFGRLVLLAMALILFVFQDQSLAKPLERWNWMDIVGEGGMVVMAGVWLMQLRASRPAGRVTDLLCLGLAAMLLGEWVDALDEFMLLPKAVLWDNWLESTLVPLGMLLVTLGLHHWRQEHRVMTEQLLRRERLFREHRSMDGVTQLGDAGYMAAQIGLELRMQRRAALLMLGMRDFETVAREHGLAEADRMLQAASHLLLLNLPPDALLCRYAADVFCVLLPAAEASVAQLQVLQLQAALNHLGHHTRSGLRLQLAARGAWALVQPQQTGDEQLLALARRLA
ncbi:GGDEF domain-containing protein [Mitsuaria sp. WAJ17]|uniref:GGDEF domain-containing protein n=1 Tax=Mitsuaria sp. WAJ17 TaxID=2761452 RepID=UPI001601ACAD|nr:GGDEF domain-containing protein [Mitsuaria sp. WAJ17]MBB2487853.1 GGDEF domain-containing protein [Mitsuaria sp. WAJ17]